MDGSQLVWLASTAMLIYFAYSTWASWYRLRHFKGPWLASVSYIWMARTALSGRAWQIHADTKEKYQDSLIRIGPDFLITDDPVIVRRINAARSPYRRDDWYTTARTDPYVHSMLSHVDEAKHQDIKTRVMPAYNGKGVPTLEADVSDQISRFKRYIRDKYLSAGATTRPIDFATSVQYFTIDLITKIAFGVEWGFLAADADVDRFAQSMAEMSPVVALTCDIPILRKIFSNSFVLKHLGPKESDASGIGKLMWLANTAVRRRFDSGITDQRDMLGAFISGGLSQRQCEAETNLAVVAGSDTTAGVTRATMLYIMTTPHVYRKLVEEIDCAIASGRASNPITGAEARALPYLQAVIFEGIRIHPPNQMLFPKLTPPEGDTLAGKFVPGGTKIAWNLRSLLRHKSTFGDDVYLFRPERWMEASSDRRLEMERHVELVFGYGRFVCMGRTIAQLELNMIFFELLRDFDFQLINPKKPWDEKQYLAFQLRDMWVRITEREK